MNNIDQKYLTAIQNNDMQTVKNIVKDVASKNGYTIEAYHGTWHKFDEFKTPAYFTTDKRYAKMFTVTDEDMDIIPVYLKLKKPLDLSKYGTKKYGWKSFLKILKDNNIDITDSTILEHIKYVSNDYIWFYIRKLTLIDEHTNKIKNLFISSGYDSIIQYDFIDRKISNKFLTYIVFNPNQIKSAELIIKDKNRNIVPITQRFNSASDKFFESILSFKQFLLEYDIDTFEKYFNQFKQETDYSVEDIAKTLRLDLGNNIEENWNKIKEEIGKLFNEVENAYENWKGGDSDSHYYAVEISSTDFDTMLDEYISENGAYSLQYIDSEIDDKFFNKILEKRMESYYISTEFASHGFLFNDGSSMDIPADDHRIISEEDWFSKNIITLHLSDNILTVRLNTKSNTVQFNYLDNIIRNTDKYGIEKVYYDVYENSKLVKHGAFDVEEEYDWYDIRTLNNKSQLKQFR